jgi:hypothetical protein
MSIKRSLDETTDDDDIKSDHKTKKRFVWPESLHRDFMRAIFSVGLRFCTAKKAQAILPSGRYDVDAIEACLQKFRHFNDSKLRQHEVHSQHKKINKVPPEIGDLTAELSAINKSINAQLILLEKFKATIAKQIAVRDDLAARLDMVSIQKPNGLEMEGIFSSALPDNMVLSEGLDFNFHPAHFDEFSSFALKSAIPPASSVSSSHHRQEKLNHPREQSQQAGASPRRRSELSMLSAMRSHMNMHRELLDLNSKYTSMSSQNPPYTQALHLASTSQLPSSQPTAHQYSTVPRPLTSSMPSVAPPHGRSAPQLFDFDEAAAAAASGLGKAGMGFGPVDLSLGSDFLLGDKDREGGGGGGGGGGDYRRAFDVDLPTQCPLRAAHPSQEGAVPQTSVDDDEFGDLFDFLF